MEMIINLLYLIVSIVIYFIPTIIAYKQKHYSLRNLFLVNLLLGWTFIGWVIAFVWALVPDIFKKKI